MTPSRILDRALRMAQQAQGGSALDRCLIAIDALGDRTARALRHKDRVRLALRRLPQSEDLRMWFSRVTRLLSDKRVATIADCLMHVAIETLRTRQREEVICRPLLIEHQALAEARLALRWLRRRQPFLDVRGLLQEMNRGPAHRPVVKIIAAE